MERFTERDDLWGNKLVLKSMAETGEHTDPWCISASSPNPITIRGAAVERLAEYEDTSLTPDEILTIDKLYRELGKEVMGYRKIGTVEECREAVEKQRVRKPVKDEYNHECCPSCGWIVFKDEYGGRCLPHCENCGQAIDWSDGEESLPHAYNVERVIERLERELSSCVDYHRKYGNCGNQIYAYKKALKIVKSGGFEE